MFSVKTADWNCSWNVLLARRSMHRGSHPKCSIMVLRLYCPGFLGLPVVAGLLSANSCATWAVVRSVGNHVMVGSTTIATLSTPTQYCCMLVIECGCKFSSRLVDVTFHRRQLFLSFLLMREWLFHCLVFAKLTAVIGDELIVPAVIKPLK